MPHSFWVTVEKVIQEGVWLLLFLTLARILGPRPYGQFAIVMVFIGFCEVMIVEATEQALMGVERLQPKHVTTANFVCVSCSAVIALILFVAAPQIATVFADAELGPIFKTLSVLPVISALRASPIAALRSELRFRVLALRSTVGLVIGGVCGLTLALYGAGVWSLVAQAIAQRVAEVIVLWLSTAQFGFGWSRQHYLELRHFAVPVLLSRGLAFVAGQFPRVILGLFVGPFEVGLFVFASRLPETVAVVALVPTTFVARSALRQYADNQSALEKAFGQLLRDTALIAFPICAGAAAIMPTLVLSVLDSHWQAATFAAQTLVLSPMAWVVFYASSALLLATKHPWEESKVSIGQTLSTLLVVLIAAPFGLDVLCLASTFRYVALIPLPLSITSRNCGISPRVFASALAPPFVAAGCMGVIVALAGNFLTHRLPPLAALPLLVILGVIVYGLIAGCWERQRAFQLIRKLQGFHSISG